MHRYKSGTITKGGAKNVVCAVTRVEGGSKFIYLFVCLFLGEREADGN